MYEGTGVGDPFVYWTLKILLLIILAYCGYGISYGKAKDFKRYAWIAGISYSLIEGLRWMRGVDYAHYLSDILTLFGEHKVSYLTVYTTQDPELLYNCFVNIVYYLHIPFWIVFVGYSAILIWGMLMVMKALPKIAVWALPIFFIFTVNSSENLIRQYIAISFLLLAYYFYLQGMRRKMWLMLIIVPLIHFSGFIAVAVFLCIVYSPKAILNGFLRQPVLYAMILLFLYAYFLWDTSLLTGFADFLSKNVDLGDERGAHYIADANRWFTNEGSLSYLHTGKMGSALSIIHRTVSFVTYAAVIYYGFYAVKADRRLTLPYICAYLYIMLYLIGGDIEMILRIYTWFSIFFPIMVAVVIIKSPAKIVRPVLTGCIALNFLWYSFLNSMTNTLLTGYGFIWDAPKSFSLFW